MTAEKTPAERNEIAMDRLAELVTKHGPRHLVRGMPGADAHEAMVDCIELLMEKLSRFEGQQRDEMKGAMRGMGE